MRHPPCSLLNTSTLLDSNGPPECHKNLRYSQSAQSRKDNHHMFWYMHEPLPMNPLGGSWYVIIWLRMRQLSSSQLLRPNSRWTWEGTHQEPTLLKFPIRTPQIIFETSLPRHLERVHHKKGVLKRTPKAPVKGLTLLVLLFLPDGVVAKYIFQRVGLCSKKRLSEKSNAPSLSCVSQGMILPA